MEKEHQLQPEGFVGLRKSVNLDMNKFLCFFNFLTHVFLCDIAQLRYKTTLRKKGKKTP
jgi:hypothetical protein